MMDPIRKHNPRQKTALSRAGRTLPLGCLFVALLVATSWISGWALAEDISDVFESANRTYEQKKYDQARDLYESVVRFGIRNGYVFYNLGNCCFAQGDVGRAVLNYERAQRLIPRYQDLQVNHKRALELLEDEEFQKFQEGLAPTVLRGVYRTMTLNELTLLIGIMLVGAAGIIEVRWLWKKPSFLTLSNYLLSFVAVVVIILGATAYFRLRNEVLREQAVVVAPEVDVRSGPGEDQGVVFTVHPGTMVQVHRRRENWVQVSLPNGYSGWVPGVDVQEIGW